MISLESYLANICEMSANVFLLGVHLRTCVEHTDGDVCKERGGRGSEYIEEA